MLFRSATLKVRIKSNGGTGKIAWLPSPATPAAEAPTPAGFSVKADGWAEIKSPITAVANQPGIIRLFLPSDMNEIDWIELNTGGKTRRWDF